MAVAGVKKGNGVQLRHVHALGEELNVADHPALAVAICVGKGSQLLVALESACRPVEVPGNHLHRSPIPHASGRCPQHLALHERVCIPFRAQYGVRKGQRARQLAWLLERNAFGDAVYRKRHPEHACHVVRCRGVLPACRCAEGFEAAAETRRDARLANPEHDDPVVEEHAVLHRLGERQQVELRAIDVVVAHVDDVDALRGKPALGAPGVDPRGGGHVQALSRVQAFVVVELLEIDALGSARSTDSTECSGRAVRLVGDGQVELGGSMVRLSVGDPSERVVGAEDHTSWAITAK